MALDTYVNLQAAIALWLQRDDMTAVIPDCIALCEKKVARRLRVIELQGTSVTNPLTETVALPADFEEVLTLEISFGTNIYSPEFIDPAPFDELGATTPTLTGIPRRYTIRNGFFEYFPAPQAGTTFIATLTYVKKLVGLATTSPNWLLTNHPDVYLYGALAASEAYSRNDPRIGLWKAGFEEAIKEVERLDSRKRFIDVGVDLGIPGMGARTDINSGFY